MFVFKSSNCALHLHCMFFPSMRAADRTWVHLFQGGLKNTFSLVTYPNFYTFLPGQDLACQCNS